MPAIDPLLEFRTQWLPNATDAGLTRLVELLESRSPLLIRGAFVGAVPMGCLASHIAWNHPLTRYLDDAEAGVCWLTRVAGLNPATSAVILAWDRDGFRDRDLVAGLLAACREEQARRAAAPAEAHLVPCGASE
jgi:hypothetical protein